MRKTTAKRTRRLGDAMRPMPTFRPEQIERFWARTRQESGACWVWRGAVGSKGYPMYTFNTPGEPARTFMAHRVAFYLGKGEDPGNYLVLHRCDVPLCINPDHLFLGSQQENIHDAQRKDRWPIGERHHSAKLTAADVREIRKLRSGGATFASIAARYSVSITNIQTIVSRQSWKHVK